MSSPTGVGRLMDAMLEREVIRNETLLLLISLTRGSEDLRKIVAFEGAFERCFNIIREEGAADGGIIVQDCLELCTNLLRGSPSNQSFFREADGLVAKLPEFLRADAGPAPSESRGYMASRDPSSFWFLWSDARARPTPKSRRYCARSCWKPVDVDAS